MAEADRARGKAPGRAQAVHGRPGAAPPKPGGSLAPGQHDASGRGGLVEARPAARTKHNTARMRARGGALNAASACYCGWLRPRGDSAMGFGRLTSGRASGQWRET